MSESVGRILTVELDGALVDDIVRLIGQQVLALAQRLVKRQTELLRSRLDGNAQQDGAFDYQAAVSVRCRSVVVFQVLLLLLVVVVAQVKWSGRFGDRLDEGRKKVRSSWRPLLT